MRKLGKRLDPASETVEAYACLTTSCNCTGCPCSCDYNTSGGYYANTGTNSAMSYEAGTVLAKYAG